MPQLDFPWEREAINAAKNGTPMLEGLSLFDQAAFQAVASLYTRYFLGKLSKEAASLEKKQIKKRYDDYKAYDACNERISKYHIDVTKKTETCRSEYRKAATPEEAIVAADKLVQAIDNIAAPHEWEERKEE